VQALDHVIPYRVCHALNGCIWHARRNDLADVDIDVIRDELLHGHDPALRRRRTIATIAAFLAAEFALLGMRQYGVLRRLPDVPLRGFDANAVTTSRAAYPLGIPDSALAVIGCGALIALATAHGSARSGRSRWLDRALAAGVAAGAAGAVGYLASMARLGRVCVYCVTGAAALLSLVPLVRGVR